MIRYKETQKGFIIIILLVALIVIFTIGYLSNTLNPVFLISMSVLLITTVLIFYKLTITIKDEMIIASLGIGILKRKVHIKDIDFSTLEKVNFSMLTGIGIRWTNKGWLWNVKVGDAIHFKTKNNKTFLVGTDDYETIVNILKK